MCEDGGFQPSISVLLPVHMREPSAAVLRQLDQAIASVLEQEYSGQMELLLIDNGPTDVAEAMRKAQISMPPALRLLRTKRANGLAYALNFGLRAAQHDWIARIDADDSWCPGKIAAQTARIAQDREITILGTGMVRNFEDGRPRHVHIRPDGWRPILKFFVAVGCPFPHGSILALKAVYKLLGGYPQSVETAHCEDFALWGVWLRFFKPAMIEKVFYNYTVSHSHVSAVHHDQQIKATLRVIAQLESLGISERLPDLMGDIARMLRISLLQAGVLCYRLWHFRPAQVRLPEAVLSSLSAVLTDRRIQRTAEAPEPLDIGDVLGSFGPVTLEIDPCDTVVVGVY